MTIFWSIVVPIDQKIGEIWTGQADFLTDSAKSDRLLEYLRLECAQRNNQDEGWQMKVNKDIIKGVLILVTFVAVLLTIFFIVDESAPNKAQCIADALKAKVPVANIDKICRLTETRPER